LRFSSRASAITTAAPSRWTSRLTSRGLRRSGLRARVAHGVLDDGACDVDASHALDALETRRAVDLEDPRAALSLEDVDPGDLEPHRARRVDGGALVLRGQLQHVGPGASVEVRTELAPLRHAPHRRDDLAAHHDGAHVSAPRLAHVLLQHDVLPHRPEGLEQRVRGLRCLGDHRADALRALLQLHDRRAPAHQLERVIEPGRATRAHGRGHVDVRLREQLQRA
jgi:hypothetical protein